MNLPFPAFRRSLQAILAITLATTGIHACPYSSEGMEINWTQPDGTKLSLRVFGDLFYARTETLEGYTVVYNPSTKAYEYAKTSPNGKKLVPSGMKANGNAPRGLAKRLDLAVDSRRAIWQERYEKLAPNERANWAQRVKAARQRKGIEPAEPGPQNDGGGQPAPPAFAPVTGAYVGLTILVQFPDDPATTPAVDPTNFPTTKVAMESYCNQIGYTGNGNTGSVRDYFLAQSLNQTDYTQVVTEIVTLPQPRNYYNWLDYPTNSTLRDGGLTGRLVLNDAITILKNQGFNFTGLTRDGSNRVVATNVLFAGATSGVWPDGLWPHRWSLSPQVNVGTVAAPIYIYDYQITNAQTASVPIGTFCHENGHLLLKYPDLYDYGGESRGCGNHCLMAGGNHLNGGKTPAPINGYFKDVVGWSNVVDITTSQFFTDSIPTTNNEGYRIRKPGTATEYFLIENRGTGDPWAQYVPDKGILIWHIDETVNGNEYQQMTASQHYEVSVEQADGFFDLEFNRDGGDSTDAFDTTYPNFTDVSAPDAKWWSGSNSGIQIAVLSSAGASMNVRFGLPANTILVSYPNGGESIYFGSTQTINWGANITGNVKIDLFKGGVLHTALSANEANDGSYSWSVSAGLPAANDYTIRITSVDTPAYLDSSNANFSIITQPTIGDALDTTGLTWTSSGNANWFAQGTTTKDGIDAAESGNIADSQSSTMEATLTGPGTMTFWWKISSESGYDYLRFYLNNVEQTGSLAKIAGEVDWIQKTVTIPAGSQTIKWTYSKDSSVDSGSDTAWVDQVVYTPTTAPEIAVEQPLNTGLTDGTASISCGSANVGSSASPVTFTVKNVGTADLTGLSISKDGSHSADFTVGSLGATTLPPAASTTFTVTFTPGAAGARNTAIHIASNDANENPFDISLTGTGIGPGTLAVTPAGDLTSLGNFGGLFTPSTVQYTLNNPGGNSINWTAAKTASWVTLDSTSGTLAAGASTTVTASIHANANTLDSGSYSDTVTFTNTTSGTGNTTRGVSLTVNPITATVNLSNLLQTYDGSPKPVTVTTTPSGLAHSVTYNGSSTVPTNGGTYAVVATITAPNYTGSANSNLVVSYTVTYQGNGNTSGTVPAAQTKFHNVDLPLATNSGNLNKTDYSFSEWNTAADGSGTAYLAGGTYSGNASLILYAQWVPGANGTWLQTTAGPFNWGDSANWSGGTVAAGADRTANFTPNFTATQTVNLESARTIGNITFTDSTTSSNDLTISGANTLTLSRTSGTPAINVTNRALTIGSVITGSNGLQKIGAGTLVFNSGSNNTLTGGFEINAGIVQYESTTSANAWGASSNVITFSGNSSLYNNNSAYTLARAITINGGVTASLTGAFGESTNVTGVVDGTGTLKVEGFSNGWALTLSNTANTFTGSVQILGGSGTSTLFVSSLGSSATNSITLSNTSNSGNFIYSGSAALSRPFVMAGTTGGSTINASGAGALTASTFSVTGAGAKLLTLDGSSGATNQISGNIVNNGGNTSVTKTGSGIWALDGTNSYSGDTNLAASGTTGVLIFQGSPALSANTKLIFAQSSSNVQSVRFLDNGAGTINFNRPIDFGGTNTSQNLNIAVGNNNTNNGGSGSGTTTGSTIQVGTITFTSTAADTGTTTLNATSPNSNGYRLQTGTITLNNLVTRTAGQTTVTVLNPTTANMTVAAITMATGNTGIANDGVPILRLDGTATDNIVTGNLTNASDFLTGQALTLQKQGTGNWALNGSGNTFTGAITFTGTTASGGKLSFASASGTNPITFNATTGFGSTLTYTGATPLTMSGLITASALTAGGILFEAIGTVPTATINYSNASSLNTTSTSTGTRYITFGGTNSGDNTFAGTINNNTGVNGNAQVAKVDAGKWVLTGSGNYTGGIFINTGTVSVNSIPSSSSNSPLGANTRINLGRDNTNGTLIYTGSGNTTNRDLRLGGPSTFSGTGGSSILNDGTGALTFTAATFNAAQTGILFNRTLTLGGSYTGAANEIQGIIQNNTASTGLVNLDKTGASTWKLSGANTYTGTTTVSAGTLELGANNVLPNTSAISVADAILDAATFTDIAGTLDVTSTSTISLGSGAALAFADSSAIDWTGGMLNLTGTFVPGASLRFGTGSTGLTATQLTKITAAGFGPFFLDANGYLTVDNTPPTLAGNNFDDGNGGGSILTNTLVTYTVTFSEDMNAATVTTVDFGNAGSAAVNIGTVTETTPGDFTVPVTPTSAGTLQLCVNAGAVLTDVGGNALITTSAIADDTIITVAPLNTAPIANSQNTGTAEDTALPITLTATDGESNPLTYSVISGPTNGTLNGTAPNLTYTPAANYSGPDGFTFKANDGSLDSAPATVDITVSPVNDAPVATAQNVSTAEEAALTITLAGSDVEYSTLTYTIVTPPANGTLNGTAPNVTYTPAADFNGAASFTFKVNDGTDDSAVETVSITVTPSNDAPVAVAQSASTAEDTALPITLAGTDVDLDTLTYTIVASPASGALNGTAPNVTYTPAADFNGTASFTFKANDGTDDSAVATVSINVTPVNDAPIAVAQSATTVEDTALPITLAGTDVDLDTLTYTIVTPPTNGTLSGTAPDLIYTSAANSNGPDSFTFIVHDGTVESAAATVSITVTPVNDTPTAIAQDVTTAEDNALPITLAGTDVENSALTYTIVTPPASGTLGGTAPDLTYTPSANSSGADGFTFLVNDGTADSAPATIVLTVTPVNDAPVATTLDVTTAEDTALPITLTGTDAENSALTYTIGTQPASGTLNGTAPDLTYTPSANSNGSDSFTFTVNDGSLDSAPTTISITVTAANDAPVATTQDVTTAEDTALPITLTGTDTENSALTYTIVAQPVSGTLTGTAPNMIYTPATDYNGSASFTFNVNDGIFDSATVTVSITVTAVNDVPVFATNPIIAAGATESIAYTGQTLASQATDVDAGNTITYSKISGPAWLAVASNGALSGTPGSGTAGLNSFVVRATDSASGSADATLQITVTGLPLPWVTGNIGTGMLAGSATYNAGTFTQAGSGIIGSTADKLRFTYQTLTGDGEVIAKISALQSTGSGSRVGVMIRDTLAANSKEIFMGMTGSNAYRWMRRTATGGSTTTSNSSTGTVPNTWVRLVRSGTTITAYKSTNGTTWTSVGSTTNTTFAATCYIGLAVGSGSDTTLNTSTFSNVSVTP